MFCHFVFSLSMPSIFAHLRKYDLYGARQIPGAHNVTVVTVPITAWYVTKGNYLSLFYRSGSLDNADVLKVAHIPIGKCSSCAW